MPVIDADTHIDETEDTWAAIADGTPYKPYTAHPSRQDPGRQPTTYWVIDGQRELRRYRDDKRTGTTVETRELLDVQARLRAMDELGFDVQVMYPTLFLTEPSDKAEVELGLRKSYNRWLARRSDESHGRLRWACLPPMGDIEEAVKELSFCKDHGAVGVLKKGDAEAGHWVTDPYFFPLYEEAQRLNMPVCFHLGTGAPYKVSQREVPYSSFYKLTLPVIHACQTLLAQRLPDQFPALRWGFVEAGASWVPYILYNTRRARRTPPGRDGAAGIESFAPEEGVFKANRMYVTCQVDEDLPNLLTLIGEDNLLMGSDYTHADQSQELAWPRLLQQRADAGEIPQAAVAKICDDNPRSFYGLP